MFLNQPSKRICTLSLRALDSHRRRSRRQVGTGECLYLTVLVAGKVTQCTLVSPDAKVKLHDDEETVPRLYP